MAQISFPTGAIFFSSPQHPDQFWDPSNLMSNRKYELFPKGLSGEA
jgi:hypothetical protein